MYEPRHLRPLSPHRFALRLFSHAVVALSLIGASLLAGMLGYRHYEHMDWVDAFVNAAMLLGGAVLGLRGVALPAVVALNQGHRGTRAIQRMVEYAPSTGGLALWVRHVDVPFREDAPLVATDGNTLRYGPGFERLPIAEQVGWVAHEVLHIGDDAHLDGVGALNAGMQLAWVNREGHAWEHAPLAPHITVNDLLALCRALD